MNLKQKDNPDMNILTIGQTTLKKEITQCKTTSGYKLLSKKLQQILSKKIWQLTNFYQPQGNQKIYHLFIYIISAQCRLINLSSNDFQLNITKSLVCGRFQYLKQLYLAKCKLTSIQSLQFLNAPLLVKLSIKDNQLISFKPLAKINIPTLQWLIAYNNPYANRTMQISRVRFFSKRLRLNGFENMRIVFDFLDTTKLNDFTSMGLINNIFKSQMQQYSNQMKYKIYSNFDSRNPTRKTKKFIKLLYDRF